MEMEMPMYTQRNLTPHLIELVNYSPIVSLIGPRQVGKTTLVKKIIPNFPREVLYLDLKLDANQNKLSEPQLYLERHADKCVIMDDIQQIPNLVSILPALLDQRPAPGRYILIATASSQFVEESSVTLAGRIIFEELTPLNLTEVDGQIKMEQHWLYGGFPPALFAPNAQIHHAWIHNFAQTYFERDLPLMGLSVHPTTMRRFLKMLAQAHGSIVNNSTFAWSLGVTPPTIMRYLDFLETACLIHRLRPFYAQRKKRLVKAPKIYIRDSGLLHYLSGIHSFEDLQGHVLCGNSWKGYVVEQIKQNLPRGVEEYFYRTHNGAESNLVLAKGDEPFACIDIQYTATPTVTKGFQQVIDDLKTEQNFIITPQSESYDLKKNIMVCRLSNFLTEQ
jgi:predicted AAA+ superfamily ATPase